MLRLFQRGTPSETVLALRALWRACVTHRVLTPSQATEVARLLGLPSGRLQTVVARVGVIATAVLAGGVVAGAYWRGVLLDVLEKTLLFVVFAGSAAVMAYVLAAFIVAGTDGIVKTIRQRCSVVSRHSHNILGLWL